MKLLPPRGTLRPSIIAIEHLKNMFGPLKLPPRETREFLTPYAFSVNEELIGMPLASPSKRFFSIMIDLLLVALLSIMSSWGFALCVAAVSTYAAITKSSASRFVATFLAACAILFLVLTYESESMPNNASSEQVHTEQLEQHQEAGGLSVLDWLEGNGVELGLSLGWAALYFTAITAVLNGRTLGKLLVGTRVQKIDGRELSWWECFERYGGYSAGFATGLLGFLQVFWDPNRQAIHDKVSETVVVDLRRQAQIQVQAYVEK